MAKFITHVFLFLICWSFIGVVGAVAIVAAQETAVGMAGAIGWFTFCALGYVLCVDLLTVRGGRWRA